MATCKRGHEREVGKKCIACDKAYMAEYRASNKERIKAVTSQWNKRNREDVLAKKRQRHKDNPEDGRRWYALLKERKPVYTVYNNMMGRCYNPKDEKYPTYGGAGITVCDRWLGESGYAKFETDMGPRPSPEHSVDRIKNEGNYEPDNCKWSSRKEQQRNRKVNVNITIGDRTQCAKAWADELGMGFSTFIGRVNRGWTGERLLIPPDPAFRKHFHS